MEKDMWTFPNRNGRVYNVDKMIDSIKEWAQSNGAWVDTTIKDVNAFYRNKKDMTKCSATWNWLSLGCFTW